MARKSRKVNALLPQEPQTPAVPERRIYKTGCYARLSVEDSGNLGADTIQVQETILRQYVDAQPDMEFCGQYSDNGWSGTNFERPAFERLMEDVRQNKIDCIVVKDLSRFGRNYKEVGNYLFRVFPFMNIRFIAIQDNFDTLTAEKTGDFYTVPLRNILNDVFVKDLSRKSCSALRTKQQNGEFIGTWAPYGYRKCPDDRHKLEPVEETAAVVRDIFRMRTEGMGYNQIARSLNRKGVLSPSTWLYQNGYVKTEHYANVLWSTSSVKSILINEVYLGHLVQGRRQSRLCEGQKDRLLPKSEWTIVRNTHEPLIDEETFRIVQRMAEDVTDSYHEKLGKYDHLGTSRNSFTGLIYCADCGRTMTRYKSVTRKGKTKVRNPRVPQKVQYYFICPNHSRDPASCPNKSILEDDLKEIIWETLQREIALSCDMEKLMEQYSKSQKAAGREQALKRDIAEAKKAYEKADMLRESLYPNYVAHIITEQDFLRMKQKYQAEMDQAKARMDAAEELLRAFRRDTTENAWLNAFQQYRDTTELTEQMAHALIERVEVDAEKHLTITLRYRDEYLALVQRLNAGEAVT